MIDNDSKFTNVHHLENLPVKDREYNWIHFRYSIIQYWLFSTSIWTQRPKCRIWFFQFWHFLRIFCPIKIDMSGTTVWPQLSGFQKLAKMNYFWHFSWTFVHSKCIRSSLRSQCWMRLFLWFSNTARSQSRISKGEQVFSFLLSCFLFYWVDPETDS